MPGWPFLNEKKTVTLWRTLFSQSFLFAANGLFLSPLPYNAFDMALSSACFVFRIFCTKKGVAFESHKILHLLLGFKQPFMPFRNFFGTLGKAN